MNEPNKLIRAKREERTKCGISSENVIFRFFRKKWKWCVGQATAKKRRDAFCAGIVLFQLLNTKIRK